MTPEQRFDIVLYRLNSAKSLLDEIKDHIERGYYNTAMNRMYYACFYAVSGLLLQSEIDGVKSHEGVRQKFSQHFILTGKFPKEWGRFYSIYKPQNKMFHFCKTFCSKITLVNTIQNVI